MPYPVNKRMFERAAHELRGCIPGLSVEEAMRVGEAVVRAAANAPQRDSPFVIPGQMTVDDMLLDTATVVGE